MFRLASRVSTLRRAVKATSTLTPNHAASAFSVTGRRNFAAGAEEDPQPPIALYGVAGKYATALYVAAAKANALEPVESELQQLLELAQQNEAFSGFLKDPSVPKAVRAHAIEEIFGEADFTPITKNFLAIMAENGRLSQLPKTVSAYEEILMAHRGEVKARVTAALELQPSEVDEIKEALKLYLEKGQTLKLEQKVDRSIIGGLVIELGTKYIDLSINSRIKQMEMLLQENL